ncbi:MAG: phage major capsid protein [Alphaproteobacteria bacterium]
MNGNAAHLATVGRIPAGAILMAAESIEDIEARLAEIAAESEAISAKDDAEDDDVEKLEGLAAEADKLQRKLAARTALKKITDGQGRRTAAEPKDQTPGKPNGGRPVVPASAKVDTRTLGFKHLGEFASVVRAAAMRDDGAQARLYNALGMNEGVGEDGGFLVPAEFRDAIMKLVEGEDSLLPLCDSSTTSRNAVTQNVDKTTPWGTTGIQVYWESEGSSTTTTGAKFDQTTLRLNKLFARVDASDELLDDAPQLDNYLRVKAPEVMTSVINLAIVQGNGVGKPLGIMNSGALVTISKETSQPADTIHHRNLTKMMGRMYAKSWPRARWLMHQDVWAQLPLLSFRDIGAYPSTATGSAVPAYMPPSGISGAPYGTLFGRPIMVLEALETIGDLGDIVLADMTAYRAVTKAGGTRVDTSIHLKFDTDETVFRFIFRLAGAPWWSAPISPRDGSNTRSPFVTIESR